MAVPGLVKAALPDPAQPKKRPVIGSGEWTYEVHHDWLVPPANMQFGDTHGLAQDREGNIYLAHTVHGGSVSTAAVCVYSPAGEFITSFGRDFAGGAHGLDLRQEGSEEFLYHCDTRRRLVVKTDLVGRVIWERGAPTENGAYPDPTRFVPTNVAFLPNGDLLVADGYGSHYIHLYSADGDYKGIIINPGKEEGKVNNPHGLWVDDRDGTPKLCVADRGNRRLQYFNLMGQPIGVVTEGIRLPCHLKYRGGNALVPDLESIVTVLDRENKVVAALGDGHPTSLRGAPRDQFIPGKFIHPHDAIWLNERDILVAEWVPIGRVTLLRHVS